MRSAILFIVISGVAVFAGLELVPRADRSSGANAPAAKSVPRKTGHEFKSERTDTAAQIDRLNKEVEHLKDKVDRLAQALQLAQASGQLHHGDSVDPPPITKDDVEAEEDLNARHYQSSNRQAELELRFAAETTDMAWVNRMETEFRSTLNRLSEFGLEDTQMVYHECRATLCNAEFVHGKGEDPQFLAVALAMPGIERITVAAEQLQDGGLPISKVYFFREGFADTDVAE